MIDAAARGAFEDLERKLRPFVARRLSSPADVDDVVQEVFLRLHRGLGQLRDDQRFGPWVYQIARNAIVDHQRKLSRHAVATPRVATDDGGAEVLWGGEILELQPFDSSPTGLTGEEHAADVVALVADWAARFVQLLPAHHREALTLTELQGMSQKDAAEMLGVSVTALKSRVQRGRQKLKEALEGCCRIAVDARGRVIGYEARPNGKRPPGCKC